MAGYDGYSMSNNARQAYQDGYKPLSKWTKGDIIAALVEQRGSRDEFVKAVSKFSVKTLKAVLLEVKEWHHTSSKFNRTDFYGATDTVDYEPQLLDSLKSWAENDKKEEEQPQVEERWEASYAEWSGTRKHPKKTMVTAQGTVRGNWFYLDDGGKKKVDGNWFRLIKKI